MFIITNFIQKVHQCRFETLLINSPTHRKMHQRFHIVTTFSFCYVKDRLLCKENANLTDK